MKKTILIVLYVLLNISLYAEDKIKIATIATDKIFFTNKTLREEYLSTFKNYKYIKHKSLFSSDIKKFIATKKTHITTNEAIKIASNMKVDFVFILDVVTTISNIQAENTSTNFTTNDFAVDLTPIDTNENTNTQSVLEGEEGVAQESNIINGSNTNSSSIIAEDSTSTNETMTNQITLSTNTICSIYVFEPSTGEITRTEIYDNLASTREKVDAISKSFEAYLANIILDSIPRPDNNIDINFFITRDTIEGSSTILEDGDELYNGDSIILNYDVNREGYLYIMLIQASGNIVLIHPNDFNTNFTSKQIPIEENKFYSIPGEDDIFKINILESIGTDKLFVVYTTRAQSWFAKDFTGIGFKIANPNTLVDKMRSIKKSLSLMGRNNYKIFTYDLKYYQAPVEDKKEESTEDKTTKENNGTENEKDEENLSTEDALKKDTEDVKEDNSEENGNTKIDGVVIKM